MQTDIVKWECCSLPVIKLAPEIRNCQASCCKNVNVGGGGGSSQEQQTVKFGSCVAEDLSKHRNIDGV